MAGACVIERRPVEPQGWKRALPVKVGVYRNQMSAASALGAQNAEPSLTKQPQMLKAVAPSVLMAMALEQVSPRTGRVASCTTVASVVDALLLLHPVTTQWYWPSSAGTGFVIRIWNEVAPVMVEPFPLGPSDSC